MGLELAVRQYRRRFLKPLHTAHGLWIWREGLLVRLQDSLDRVGYGEIAPIPWFGSETLEEALHLAIALGLAVNIEIKPCPGREAETAEAAIAVVRATWPTDRDP
ncbi:hypothetical protein C8255_17945, partial [filamentous cyanobacterium CCP3]